MTNGDKIRAIDDSKLAEFINNAVGESSCDHCYYDKHWNDGHCEGECKHGYLKWLESEAG